MPPSARASCRRMSCRRCWRRATGPTTRCRWGGGGGLCAGCCLLAAALLLPLPVLLPPPLPLPQPLLLLLAMLWKCACGVLCWACGGQDRTCANLRSLPTLMQGSCHRMLDGSVWPWLNLHSPIPPHLPLHRPGAVGTGAPGAAAGCGGPGPRQCRVLHGCQPHGTRGGRTGCGRGGTAG